VVLPWIVVIPFLTGNGLNNILTWGTLFFTSIANFVIPFVVYIQSCRFKKSPRNLDDNQKHILHELKLVPVYIGSINEFDEELTYQVIPSKYKFVNSKMVAFVSCVALSIATLVGIVLNIIAVV